MDELKIALVGYGSMGKEIERLAAEKNIIITEVFDINSKLSEDSEYKFDVALDFSFPDAVAENARILTAFKKNIVIGTTGWLDKKEKIFEYVNKSGCGMVYGSNFSIGMQLFSRILRFACQLLNKTEDYDIMLHEMHHKRKKDSPSGTALSLADIILEEVFSKSEAYTETMHGTIQPEQLHISSTRGGEITGTHTVYIDSAADTIELIHRAKNRSGLASGALTAAKWIKGRSGVYNFDEVLDFIWE